MSKIFLNNEEIIVTYTFDRSTPVSKIKVAAFIMGA
jgi:hypothetical protein